MTEAETHRDTISPWLEWTFTLAIAFSLISIPAASVMLAAACVAAVAEKWQRRELAIDWPPVVAPLGLYLLTTLIAIGLSPEPAAGWGTARKLVLLLIVLLAPMALRSTDAVYRAFAVISFVGAVSALVGVWQFVFGFDPFHALHHHFPVDPSRPVRVTGFMSHWMTFSGQVLLVSLLSIAFALFGEKRQRRLWALAAALTAVGVALSLTRSAWLALFIGFLVLLWWKKRLAAVVLLLLVPLAWLAAPDIFRQRVTVLLNPSYGPLSTRTDAFYVGLNIMREHPFLGIGPGRMDRVFWQYAPNPETADRAHIFTGHLHSNLLQLAAERGVPCALSFLWLIGMVLLAAAKGFQKWRGDPRRAAAAAAVFASVLGFFAAGMFEFNFGDSEVLSLILLLSVTPYLVAEEPRPDVRGIVTVLSGRPPVGERTTS